MKYKSKNYLHGNISTFFHGNANRLSNFYEKVSDVADDFLFDRRGESYYAVCLSGEASGQNEGQGAQPNDSMWIASEVTGSITRKLALKIRRFGIEDQFFPNVWGGGYSMVEKAKVLDLHPWAVSMRTEEFLTDSIKFGDVLKVTERDDGKLIWEQASGEDVQGLLLGGTVEIEDLESYNFGDPGNLGEYTTPCPKCKRGNYIGAYEEFHEQELLNGQLPSELLGRATVGYIKPILMKEVIPAYDSLAKAFKQAFPDNDIGASGNRSFAAQVACKAKWVKKGKPHFAATPGTSKHGWALAFDWQDKKGNRKAKGFESDEYKWMFANAPRYGFHNPKWAQPGGRPQEPWHFEWINFSSIFKT